jgi:hypothetical protein
VSTTIVNDFSAIEGLQIAFESATDIWQNEFTRAMQDNNQLLREALADPPAQEHLTRREVYGEPFKSDKQRRWFFAALRDGEIQVPYQRTGELASSWQSDVQTGPAGVWGQVWTNLYRARYAEDAYFQSLLLPYWQTAQSVNREAHEALIQRFVQAASAVNRRMFARSTSE